MEHGGCFGTAFGSAGIALVGEAGKGDILIVCRGPQRGHSASLSCEKKKGSNPVLSKLGYNLLGSVIGLKKV